jgi:hypothetical protein
MIRGLQLAGRRVSPGGQLFISIYNDQGGRSTAWRSLKKCYVNAPSFLKPVIVTLFVFLYMVLFRVVLVALATGVRLVTFNRPWEPLRQYFNDLFWSKPGRGMSWWCDAVDWVGGYPFEVAKPEVIFDLYRKQGFQLQRLGTCGGSLGCNQFVFQKQFVSDS